MPHRYFSTEITQGRAWLSEADSRHLCVVMRAQAGQAVTVCDGRGTDYACRLAAVSPTRAGLDILSSEACVSEPSVRVILYVGYPKQDKLEHIIQKATAAFAWPHQKMKKKSTRGMPALPSRPLSRPGGA